MKTKNKIPMRQCTGCREMKSKKEMLRVLKTTEDEIVLDTTGKKNGRGAYLCLSRECLDKAIKNHGLERSLKTAVPDEVYERSTAFPASFASSVCPVRSQSSSNSFPYFTNIPAINTDSATGPSDGPVV